MRKVKSPKNEVEPSQINEFIGSEVTDLLKTIEEMGRKAGCMLDASKESLAGDEILLLKDVQALGVRAVHLMEQKMSEGYNRDKVVISKSLSKTDIGYHLTLTTVEDKLNELHVLWGQHGQLLEVTDLTDNAEMEFTFVIWSHNKGCRAVLTGAWKTFCRKHGLRVGEEICISVSDQSSEEYILSAGKSLNPLAVLRCKKVILSESGDQDADGTAGFASTHSTTASREASSLDNMQEMAVFNESRDVASMEECDNEKSSKMTEDEKIIELADYLFKLSRWGSPVKSPRTS